MSKHIGIVACSAEGAALCYRTICAEGPALLGPHAHPEITMHTYPLSQYMEPIYRDDWEGVGKLMVASAANVARTGAQFAICPDNTIHQAFDYVSKHSVIPWLHIAQEVAQVAKKNQYHKIGVLGTRYLMEGPVYPGALITKGMQHEIPTAEQRQRINEIIFDELVYGKFEQAAREYFSQVIVTLKDRGCDAVVLGCTEIPLLIAQEDSALPILDSTRILARAALAKATESA
ncbi:MAG: amino acid racemase [Cyanobacteria bacterium SZAS TMP-1]|nr:amino acid racemase [Cyanobacteria bacterium SZAS TMP-1]